MFNGYKLFVPFFPRLKERINLTPKIEKRERVERKGVRENRGKRRERPQTIQSHSIFEQGPADTLFKTGAHLSFFFTVLYFSRTLGIATRGSVTDAL